MDVRLSFRLSLLVWVLLSGTAKFCSDAQSLPYDWDQIGASSELKDWHACYDGFECAKLEVPLDWKNLANSNKVVLAITRLPAKVDRADASYGGPILLNPGGPGGSGVNYVVWSGSEIQANVDGDKHFDIVSFDPRGVFHTVPSSACFNSSLSKQLYDLKTDSHGTIDISDEIFNYKWAAVHSSGTLCEESEVGRYPDGSSIHQFLSTAMVAYDMLAIIDKLEEARNKSENGPKDSESPALLQYWGLSYGTVLGNTFASMFPSRVGRLVLDGVSDADDYITTTWSQNAQDSPKAWALFSQLCYEAKWRCALYDRNTTSSQDIALKLSEFLDFLKENPMPVVYNGAAQVVTYSDVISPIFQALGNPGAAFLGLAKALANLISGNTSSIAATLSQITVNGEGNCNESNVAQAPTADPPPVVMKYNNSWDRPPAVEVDPFTAEATRAITCGDGNPIQNRTKAEHKAYLELLISQAPLFAGAWAELPLKCIGWPESLRPSDDHRFTGPFGSRLRDLDTRGSPILWIGNTADPRTPLHNAYKMAETHEGSVVLVVDQAGHGNGPTNPSVCVYAVLQKYFNDGVLPEEGMVCKSSFVPWFNEIGDAI